MSAADARWLAIRSMTTAAISINSDLRITAPHLLQTGDIVMHVGARLWEDFETW
jgi:hypothetical protein